MDWNRLWNFLSGYWMIPELKRLPRPRQKALFKAGYRAFVGTWRFYATGGVWLFLMIIGSGFWKDSSVGDWVAKSVSFLIYMMLQFFFVNRELRRMLAAGS